MGNNGVVYDTAGTLKRGRRVWVLARMESQTVLGDEVVPYLLFSNGHDGRHAVRVAITPIRVVCNNTLNLALSKAHRSWATMHIGQLDKKFEEASRTLGLAYDYMKQLNRTAEKLIKVNISEKRLQMLVEKVLPPPNDESKHGIKLVADFILSTARGKVYLVNL